jgi:membrane protease subunit (stomatin/prohibitin family)
MPEFIEFTSNYHDLSTERGFQWEFRCERCNNGYRSKFRASATGLATEVLDVAGGVLGGIFGTAANVGQRVHSAAWERAHDENFSQAAKEVRPYFVQCPRCNNWICRQRCWNEKRGLCFNCAPDTAVEAAAAQAGAITDQAVEEVRGRKYDVKDYVAGDELSAACPSCGAALKAGAKFCAECGTPIKQNRFCTECGSPVEANVKFCPSCGAKQA